MESTKLESQDTNSIEELQALLLKEDPDFKPERVPGNPWRRVTDHTLFPELKIIKHGNGTNVTHVVLDTPGNLQWLLNHFGATLRYNLMTRNREITIPGLFVFKDDRENDTLARIEMIATLNEMPVKNIDKWLNLLCAEKSYHPIVDCLAAKPWDGVPRLETFIGTLTTTRPSIDNVIIKTWLTAAVAAVHMADGFVNHGVLVIQGSQGIGKTEWIKSLDPINCNAVQTGTLLEPRNKDSVITSSAFWIVELGELDATLNKTDIAHLKSFITNGIDLVRTPWARKNSHFVRRTVYAASVNNPQFLVDDTGNRRWWTIAATAIDYQHGFDMQQVWAEVYAGWRSGWLTYLPDAIQKEVDNNNKRHERIDPLREKLLSHFDWSCQTRREITATEVLYELGYLKPSQSEATRMGKLLMEINGKTSRRSNQGNVHSVPRVIPKGNPSFD